MSNQECIFCKIAADEMPSEKVYHDEVVTAFRDINPVAPTHILIIPNKHIVNTNDLTKADEAMMGHMFSVVKELAEKEGIAESGYRLIMNTGPDGNQVVMHMHLHLIGGQKMKYPMG